MCQNDELTKMCDKCGKIGYDFAMYYAPTDPEHLHPLHSNCEGEIIDLITAKVTRSQYDAMTPDEKQALHKSQIHKRKLRREADYIARTIERDNASSASSRSASQKRLPRCSHCGSNCVKRISSEGGLLHYECDSCGNRW